MDCCTRVQPVLHGLIILICTGVHRVVWYFDKRNTVLFCLLYWEMLQSHFYFCRLKLIWPSSCNFSLGLESVSPISKILTFYCRQFVTTAFEVLPSHDMISSINSFLSIRFSHECCVCIMSTSILPDEVCCMTVASCP
jgi:hypothetical protein